MEDIGLDHGAAVVWDAEDRRGQNGQPVLSDTPRETPARWDRRRREVRGPDGDPLSLEATLAVLEEVPLGSVVWEGTLADWGAAGTGQEGEFYEAVTVGVTPDIKGRELRLTVGLARYRGTPPAGG